MTYSSPRIEISVFTDISVLRFYGYIENIGEIFDGYFFTNIEEMLEKTLKNDKISKNTRFKVIL